MSGKNSFAGRSGVLSMAGLILAWAGLAGAAQAAEGAPSLDITGAVVVSAPGLTGPEAKAAEMLAEEVGRRSYAQWPLRHAWPSDDTPVIAVGRRDGAAQFAGPYAADFPPDAQSAQAEGYEIRICRTAPSPHILVVGNDAQGTLFGCGRLLREMRITRESVSISAALAIRTAPVYPLRGHQLGFRPKVNTYDGWTVPMFEQYYRDLIVFGANAVELIPPRSDDDDDSPHFPLPKIEMMAEMSRLALEYGLQLWIWYPAMDADYTDKTTVEFALREWGEVFARLPHISVVFVPGGDPGHTHPKVLFDLLEKQTAVLRQYHPHAEMWMSPQSFDLEWTEVFYRLVQAEPAWLGGIVFGPQNRVDLPTLREKVPARYPIRRYPDITHSLHCQYPVPNWDPAYGLTENREVINPRPMHYTHIFRIWDEYSCGFITYSEGCNDDVNKAIWSALGWDPGAEPIETLRSYARYFIGPEFEDDFAQGLLALERNWMGPLLSNENVETTLSQFETMAAKASPAVKANWRFQQALYRAYYDAYNRRRLLYETHLEQRAMDVLRQAERLGAHVAMRRAEEILDEATLEPVAQDLRARVFELAEALFQSIRMQLSVPRYDAIHVRRGANLDLIDFPLNDSVWLKTRFEVIRAMPIERERLRAIDELVNWTNPGPGGFYDNLGDLSQQPHLVQEPAWEEDPEHRRRPNTGIHNELGRRMSWMTHAESRYDAPLHLRYEGLDPGAQYVVKVTYAGEPRAARIRLVADEKYPVHGYMDKPNPIWPVSFDVPREATADGQLTLSWNHEPDIRGAGRGNQISEVWLMKKDAIPK